MAAANQVPRVLGLSLGKHAARLARAPRLRPGVRRVLRAHRAAAGALPGGRRARWRCCSAARSSCRSSAAIVFRGKSGFCGSLCPLRPAQGLYSPRARDEVEHSHCKPCVGCSSTLPGPQADDRAARGARGPRPAAQRLPPAVRRRAARLHVRVLHAARRRADRPRRADAAPARRDAHRRRPRLRAAHADRRAARPPHRALRRRERSGSSTGSTCRRSSTRSRELHRRAGRDRGRSGRARAFVGVLHPRLARPRPAARRQLLARHASRRRPAIPVVAAAAAPAPVAAAPVTPGARPAPRCRWPATPVAAERRAGRRRPPRAGRRRRARRADPRPPRARPPDAPAGRHVLARGPPRRGRGRHDASPRPPAPPASRCPRAATPACAAATRSTCSPAPTSLSAVSDDEGSTLMRIGLPAHARLACSAEVHGDVTVSIAADAVLPADGPTRPPRPPLRPPSLAPPTPRRRSRPAAASTASSSSATASPASPPRATSAGSTRRARSTSSPRRPHPFYNRIAVARLIHDRAGMRRMQLLPDSWYEAQRIEQWLNTSVDADRPRAPARAARHRRDARVRPAHPRHRRARDDAAARRHRRCPASSPSAAPATRSRIRAYVQDQRVPPRGHRRRRPARPRGRRRARPARHRLHRRRARRLARQRRARRAQRRAAARSSLEERGIEVITGAPSAASTAPSRAETRRARRRPRAGRRHRHRLRRHHAERRARARRRPRRRPRRRRRRAHAHVATRRSSPAATSPRSRGAVAGRWPAAVAQGEVAAVTALGGERTYDARPIPTRLKVIGHRADGDRPPGRPARRRRHRPRGPDGEWYRKLVVSRGRLRGAVAFGPAPGLDAAVAAVREGRYVTTVLDQLRAGDWTALDRRSRARAPPRPDGTGARRSASRPPPRRLTRFQDRGRRGRSRVLLCRVACRRRRS